MAYILDDALNITRRMSGELDEEYRVPPPHPGIDDAPRSVSKIDKILDVIGSWESKFQKLDAIEEMQAKINKMEKQLHSQRESTKESARRRSPAPEVRAYPEPPPISIKDAVETVPTFDGSKPSVFQFLRACERAKSMVPPQYESHLVKLLMNKLRGYAFLAVEDASVSTVKEFGNRLKDMFAPAKTVNEYRGELGSIYQRPGEEIFSYIDRVKNLRLAIIDGEQSRHGNISTSLQESIDMDTREAFLRGLPHDVYMRTMLVGCDSLDEAYRQAVNSTREMELINDRQRPSRPAFAKMNNPRPTYSRPTYPAPTYSRPTYPAPTYSRPTYPAPTYSRPTYPAPAYTRPENLNYSRNHVEHRAPINNSYTPQNGINRPNPNLSCTYCKKLGHVMRDCFKFKARADSERNQQQHSGNGSPRPGNASGTRTEDPPNRSNVRMLNTLRTEIEEGNESSRPVPHGRLNQLRTRGKENMTPSTSRGRPERREQKEETIAEETDANLYTLFM